MPPGPRFTALVNEAKQEIQEVNVADAAQQQSQGVILIDVREQEEFDKQHARGAVHLSKGVLELKIEEHVPNSDTPILCYCGGGSRSALAAVSLKQMGYSKAMSVIGGFKAWQAAGLPTES